MADSKSKTSKIVGISLVVLSGVLWLLIPLVHMLKISFAWKATIDGILFVAAEIAFWVGTVLAGKDFLIKLKNWFKSLNIWKHSGRGRNSRDTQA